MGEDNLINKLEEYIHLTESEEETIREVFKPKSYKASEHIHWAQGESAYFIYVVSGEVDFRGITMEANSLLQIDSAFGEVNITSNSSKTRYICVHISKK